LPSLKSEQAKLTANIKLSEINEKQIKLDRLQRELSDPQGLADSMIDSVSFRSDVNRESLDLKIQELVTNRLDIIHKLRSGNDRIFKFIQSIEFTKQKPANVE
jgi:hypothetical protein